VIAKLLVTLVAVAPDGRLLEGAVHSLNLTVGLGVMRLGQTMFDAEAPAGAIEGMAKPSGGRPLAVSRQIGELNAVVGEHRVDLIRHRCHQCLQKGASLARGRLQHELGESVFRGPVHGNKEVELAFLSPHLGGVDVEVADRMGFELLRRLVAFGLREPAGAVPLQAATQGRPRQMWDRRLQRIATVIQRQQRMLAEGGDDRLLLGCEYCRMRGFRPRRGDADPPRQATRNMTAVAMHCDRGASTGCSR